MLGGAVALTGLWARPADAEAVLNVTVYGGSFEDGWRKAVIEPFQAANPAIKVNISQGLTFQAAALARAQSAGRQSGRHHDGRGRRGRSRGRGSLAAAHAAEQCPTSPTSIQNSAPREPGYVKVGFSSLISTYNTREVSPAPQSWADYLGPEPSAARSRCRTSTRRPGILFFLIVNEMNGGSLDNVEPGFAAMKKLKAGVVAFTEQHAQIAQLLTQGDMVMVPWASDRAVGLNKAGVPVATVIPKEGSFIGEQTLSIAKGTKQPDAALAYVDFALSRQAQEGNARYTYISPVSSKAVLDGETAQLIPHGPEIISKLRRPDWSAVNARRAQWIERWSREILT